MEKNSKKFKETQVIKKNRLESIEPKNKRAEIKKKNLTGYMQ